MAKISKKIRRASGHKKKKKHAPSRPGELPRQSNNLQQALDLHQAGRLPEAEMLYRQILRSDPDHPEALHYLGVLAHEVGRNDVAVELIRRALAAKPDNASLCFNLGNALEELGRAAEAVDSYRQAISLDQGYVEAHYNLGLLLQAQGKLAEATESFRRAAVLRPDYVEAHNNLGILLQVQGKLAEAAESFHRAVALRPDYAAAHNNLGIALKDQGRLDEAAASFHKAIDIKPDYAAAYSNLGMVLKDQGRADEAVASFRKAIDMKPDYAEAYYNLGIVYKQQGRTEEAVAGYRHAITLKPDYVEAYSNLGSILKDEGKLEEAIANFRSALNLRPDYAEVHSNLLFCLNYLTDQPIVAYLEEARQYGRHITARVGERFSDWLCPADPERICVGLVSGDFREHPVGYFLENILENIDPRRIDLIAYPTSRAEDELTARIRSRFVAWKPLAGMYDAEAARLIHNDGVHILIDLSGHTSANRLPVFAWKPAPVQATWLGYFASTGVKEMDYIIADQVSIPAEHKDHFSEKVWYLPETRFCFSPPVTADVLPPTPLPALSNGYITFGCFQNFTKISDNVLAVWSRIFQQIPNARLRLQNSMLNSPAIRGQILQRLARNGIEPERITLEKAVPRLEYLAAHTAIDIILDTFPATGGTTTCEALWMGVPTVTLAGNTMLARESASQLSSAGLNDWIADNQDDYVTKAVTHAKDLEKLSRLRAGLRQQVLASPLFDGPRFARNFEMAMWEMWRCFKEVYYGGKSE